MFLLKLGKIYHGHNGYFSHVRTVLFSYKRICIKLRWRAEDKCKPLQGK